MPRIVPHPTLWRECGRCAQIFAEPGREWAETDNFINALVLIIDDDVLQCVAARAVSCWRVRVVLNLSCIATAGRALLHRSGRDAARLLRLRLDAGPQPEVQLLALTARAQSTAVAPRVQVGR